MNENIDLTKILKDCPKGTKLYSTIFGEVEFKCINNNTFYPIQFRTRNEFIENVTSRGCHHCDYNGECTLFPSKEQRDWYKFTASWYKNEKLVELKESDDKKIKPRFKVGDWITINKPCQIVNINDNGNYIVQYWDDEKTHELSKNFCESYFCFWTILDAKDGDVICYKDEISLYKNDIKNCTKQETKFGGFVYYCCYYGKRFITNSFYLLTEQDKIDIHPATKEQRDALMKAMNDAGYEWNTEKKELNKKEKFDPKTLKPFDKVLASDLEEIDCWVCGLFSYYNESASLYPCRCVGSSYKVCIPYNDETKHLVGTSDEVPEYYKYWED